MRNVKSQSDLASPQQEHLWALSVAGRSVAYRSQQAVLIDGHIDKSLLKKALSTVVNRHEILRTTLHFAQEKARLMQTVAATASACLDELSLSRIDAEDQAAAVQAAFNSLRRRPFDFDRGPLLHVQVIKLSREKQVLLTSLSALCGDAETVSNLLDELGDAYSNAPLSRRHPEPPLQYADFAQWQRDVFESEEAEPARRYWRKKDLSKFGLDLPFKMPGYARRPFEPTALTLKLDRELCRQLEAFSRSYETPMTTLWLAAWIILLWRVTARPDPVVGLRCDGRKYAELSNALGLFARYLPLQCDLQVGLRFDELLKRVRQSADDVVRWQESFNWAMGEGSQILQATEPFCTAGFEFVAKRSTPFFGDAATRILSRYECIDRFEIKLSLVDGDPGLGAELHFDSDIFRREEIQRLGERLLRILRAAAANPKSAIAELPILDGPEQHYLLVEFNDSQVASGAEKIVHRGFEKQASRTPEAIAVVCGDEHLTYAALDQKANQLASHLRKLGVEPESTVGLCTHRSADMMVGLLAVLKAGGAYVPLEPEYPSERLAYMLEDCRAQIVLTQSRLADRLPLSGIKAINLDLKREWAESESGSTPSAEVSPQNVAYIIYTSGSTGRPKGVAVEHRQLMSYSHGIAERLAAFEGAGYAALSTLAADLGNTAIFPSLLTGGCLHVISHEAVREPGALAEFLEDHYIDHLKITPSHLAAIQGVSRGGPVMPRRTLVLGGEALSAEWVWNLRAMSPDCAIINHYGPTETTVGALVYDVRQVKPIGDASANVPLGRPLAGMAAYILDGMLSPTPAGITGEIYLSGEGVSRGYFDRPDTTAERFMPCPFSQEAGSRMYRTGDLARHRVDGAIEFLGRLDFQVKIRGFRIELQEIEAALIAYSSVRNAVVIAHESRPRIRRLVAYVESKSGETISDQELSDYLRQRLPDYMIPSQYVAVPTLKLMANGKVDRRALPAPGEPDPLADADFATPRTEMEEHLARIWAEVLGIERVSIHGNFFRLGGDSILTIQVVSRARAAGYSLSVKDLFEHQTIAELAGVVNLNQVPKAEQELITGEIPLTPIQCRFFEQDFSDPHHWNQFVVLEARRPLLAPLLEEALAYLLIHHDALRLRFIREGSALCQVSAEAGVTPFAQIDLSILAEPHRTQAFESLTASAQASLNLSEGPLIRAVLFHLGHQEPDCLLLIIHHLSCDVVTWRILVEDLQAIYRQLCEGEPVRLPEKTTSYRRWANYLVERSSSPELLKQADYWLATSGEPNGLLPIDYQYGVNSEASARTVIVSLDAEDTEALIREIPRVYQTQIDDVLLTAIGQAFAQWTGSQELLVDIESHGRYEQFAGIDLSRTAGWFTSIYPLRLDVTNGSQPQRVLKSVKEQLRRVPERGLGYGLLRYLSGADGFAEKLRSLPAPQVSYNYVGQWDPVFLGASIFTGTREMNAPRISPRAMRAHLIEMIGRVVQGRLQFYITYSENIHRRDSIERLGQDFLSALRVLIRCCLSDPTGGFTPSDFPDVDLTQDELEELMAKFG